MAFSFLTRLGDAKKFRYLLHLAQQASVSQTSAVGKETAFDAIRRFASYPPHTVVTFPSLSPTMTQGNITKWKKKEGEIVASGQLLAEVETDKATIDWESQEEGIIAKILQPDGSKDIPCGSPVAILCEEGTDISAFKNYVVGGAPAAPPPTPSSPAAKPAAPRPATKAAPASSFPPHTVLNMPALSPTMSQGNIIEWKKKVGDAVAAGELFCEVETDKATMGWESQEDGFIAQILLPSNSKDISVGTPVLILVDDKAAVAAFASYSSTDAVPGSTPPASPAADSGPLQATPSPVAAARPSTPAPSGDGRVKASPYAKKLALEKGISLVGVTGSGPEGRIVAADVDKAVASGKTTSSAPASQAAGHTQPPALVSGASFVDIPHTQMRRVIAQRLLESKQTIPHYYLTVEVNVDAMLKLREQINAAGATGGSKISVNDFVIKAASLALKKVPGVNASWQNDFTRQYSNVDISVAVQTPTGLLTPIVKDADRKGLGSISSDVKALAAKAKEGKLQPQEFIGGTFTISNLGMYGIKQFAAIVNPPQAAILAVGGTDRKVVLAKSGQFEQISTMNVTLSCDHRVIDGAMGAEWLQAFKGFVENPYTMLL